jgi:hypothetical protein
LLSSVAECPFLPVLRVPVAWKEPPVGSNVSAVAKPEVEGLKPPAINTLPLFKSVEVCDTLESAMLPVLVNKEVEGS